MRQKVISSSLRSINAYSVGIVSPVLLVTGKKSYETSGGKRKLDVLLKGFETYRFSDFDVNPKLEDVKKGLSFIEGKNIKTIIAIGGGSVIDMGKCLKAFSCSTRRVEDYIEKLTLEENPSVNLIAIPMSSGSGSEATHFAVVYIGKKKYSLSYPFLLPKSVILDYELTSSLSSYQTACSGFDALAQGVESMWNVNRTSESEWYANKAIKLALKHLVLAVTSPCPINRKGMQRAAYFAGKAINISKTTGAHAFSYYLTSHLDIPHGHAVGLLLSVFFTINGETKNYKNKNQMSKIYKLLKVKNAEEASLLIKMTLQKCGLEPCLTSLVDLDTIYDEFFLFVNHKRLSNNPENVEKEKLYDAIRNGDLLFNN